MNMKTDTIKSKTANNFKLAFFDLLGKESADDIGINDICQKAGYSKQTFYRYFEDKSDFIDRIINDEIIYYHEVIEETVRRQGGHLKTDEDIEKVRLATFRHVYNRRIYFQNLFYYPCFREFKFRFIEFLKWNDKLPIFMFANNSGEDIDYLNYICTYFHYATIDYWINEGFAHSPEEIAELNCKTMKGINFITLNSMGLDYNNIHQGNRH